MSKITASKIKKIFSFKFPFSRPSNATPVNDVFVDENYAQAVAELEQRKQERSERLQVILKRRTYFKYFNVRQRYGISFKEFNRRVDIGIWEPVMAD